MTRAFFMSIAGFDCLVHGALPVFGWHFAEKVVQTMVILDLDVELGTKRGFLCLLLEESLVFLDALRFCSVVFVSGV